MPTVQRSFHVSASPETVIGYLKDFSHAEEWDPGTQRCTRIDPDGPVAEGVRWHNVSKIAGFSTELTYTLRELGSERLVFVGVNDTASSTDTITVRADRSGSQITYRAELDLHGAARLASPVFRLVFEKLATDTRKQLSAVLNRLG